MFEHLKYAIPAGLAVGLAAAAVDAIALEGRHPAWFAFAFLSVPNKFQDGEGVLLTYFILTAFFLVYVPFSKISHYLYYPFTRYYLGKTLGHRGVYPMKFNFEDMMRDFFKPNQYMAGKEK